MPADSSSEAVEIVTASVDKFLATENYEVRTVARCGPVAHAHTRAHARARVHAHQLARTYTQPLHPPPHRHRHLQKASQAIKDGFDKKFGPSWHCVVGEGFGYHITCNAHNMLYLYYGEKLGILVFKC